MDRFDIKVIAFDADDTLWDNQTWYDKAEEVFVETLNEYGSPEYLSETLYHTEMSNMPVLGYGAKAVCISMMETALKLSKDCLKAWQMEKVLSTAKSLLQLPATPLPDVEDTLKTLSSSGKYRMILLTKGDILDQQNKVDRSGLKKYFDRVVVVSDKKPEVFSELCQSENIVPSQLLMVGNSFKSDIKPVIAVGGYGAYIPFHTTWKHEVVEEFSHPSVSRLSSIKELVSLLWNI